ncbi:MAG: class I SAM-dependent methyltransferase [Rhodospirillales bacterium]
MTEPAEPRPSPWVTNYIRLVRDGGIILDLACGQGRHTRLAAGLGYAVVALDRNSAALELLSDLKNVKVLEHDLEAEGAVWPFDEREFDGIIVSNYLHRPLFPQILSSLADGGVLIYETFASGNEAFGKPSRPAFLLREAELLERAAGLTVVAFEQGRTADPSPAVRQRICAVRGTCPADIPLA